MSCLKLRTNLEKLFSRNYFFLITASLLRHICSSIDFKWCLFLNGLIWSVSFGVSQRFWRRWSDRSSIYYARSALLLGAMIVEKRSKAIYDGAISIGFHSLFCISDRPMRALTDIRYRYRYSTLPMPIPLPILVMFLSSIGAKLLMVTFFIRAAGNFYISIFRRRQMSQRLIYHLGVYPQFEWQTDNFWFGYKLKAEEQPFSKLQVKSHAAHTYILCC